MKIKINNKQVFAGCLVAALLVIFLSSGFTGFLSVSAFTILFYIPGYLLLIKTSLDGLEKSIFALFLGLALVGIGAYFINLIVPSLRWSFMIMFIILSGIGIWKRK